MDTSEFRPPQERLMTSPRATWHRAVGALGLVWGALELSALGSGFPDTGVNFDLYTLWLLVLSLATIGLGLGLPGWILLSPKRPTRRTALVAAGLVTLATLFLLCVAAVAHFLRNSPSIEPSSDSLVQNLWLLFLAAALVRLPVLVALVSASARARPQTPR
jgi:MFS family permease